MFVLLAVIIRNANAATSSTADAFQSIEQHAKTNIETTYDEWNYTFGNIIITIYSTSICYSNFSNTRDNQQIGHSKVKLYL